MVKKTYPTEFIAVLVFLFTLCYGISEFYVHFIMDGTTNEFIIFNIGLANFILLLFFSSSILYVLNWLKVLNIWTVALSGMLTPFLKDIIIEIFLFGSFGVFLPSLLTRLIFGIIFGTSFMLALYVIVKEGGGVRV